MSTSRYLVFVFLVVLSMSAHAQTCAAPSIITTAPAIVSGTTCSGTTSLPTLANGAMAGGQQTIYRITLGTGAIPGIQLNLQPDPDTDMALFVCPNVCSPIATCIATVDENGTGQPETFTLPSVPGDYYIIVQAAPGSSTMCGGYSLVVTGPLND